jgi:hypothetical protein
MATPEENNFLAKAKENKTLNKPFRTPKGPKKFSVYVKNEKGNTVKVNFGDPNMEIKRDDPQRRKNFRARHNCDNAGPKTKARYWSCKMWERKKSVTDYTSGSQEIEMVPQTYEWDGETFFDFDELLSINPSLAFVEEEITEGEEEDCCGKGCGCHEENSEAALSKKQQKLPPALQKAILKKQGKKTTENKDEDKEEDKDEDKKEGEDKESKPTKGLSKKQQKLPPALQKAILKRQSKAETGEGYASLWKNIHEKRERIKSGSGEKMRKKGDKGAPTPAQLKKAKSTEVNPEGTGGGYKIKKEFKAAKRSGPKSAAQTPSKPSERRKGSSKNKKGSAGESGSSITFSENTTQALKNKVKEHNSKSAKKVTLSQLKKVYRRGAGAFSGSHRPGQSRGSWAMARVNMFLKMKRGGKVKQSYRAADGDI